MIKARRYTLLAALLAMALTADWPFSISVAQERKLSAAEIEDRLVGNTIQGLWYDQPYLQFFDGSGNTLYAEDGSQPTIGKWWVDEEKDEYCSSRQGGRSACYEVLDGGPDAIIWALPSSGKKFPAKVLQGDQIPTKVQKEPIF